MGGRSRSLLVAAVSLTLACGPARAGLIGKDVDVLEYYPNLTATPVDFNAAALSTPVVVGPGVEYDGNSSDADYNSAAGTDGVTIDVSDTQIFITNLFGGVPFCSDGTSKGASCTDTFNGLEFLFSNFSTGESITGVTVDPLTAADFQPAGSGLSLDTMNDIFVNLVGDAPAADDQLVLDVTVSSPTPPPASVPEPTSLSLLGAGLLGLAGFSARRRRQRRF
jgi:hypothetical protein